MKNGKPKTTEIGFTLGHRKEAIEVAIEIVKMTGQSAEIIICKDIPGKHTGGEDCFCSPRILIIQPKDLE